MSIRPGYAEVKRYGNGLVSARLHLQEAPSHYPRHVPQNTFVDANDFIHPDQQMSSCSGVRCGGMGNVPATTTSPQQVPSVH